MALILITVMDRSDQSRPSTGRTWRPSAMGSRMPRSMSCSPGSRSSGSRSWRNRSTSCGPRSGLVPTPDSYGCGPHSPDVRARVPGASGGPRPPVTPAASGTVPPSGVARASPTDGTARPPRWCMSASGRRRPGRGCFPTCTVLSSARWPTCPYACCSPRVVASPLRSGRCRPTFTSNAGATTTRSYLSSRRW